MDTTSATFFTIAYAAPLRCPSIPPTPYVSSPTTDGSDNSGDESPLFVYVSKKTGKPEATRRKLTGPPKSRTPGKKPATPHPGLTVAVPDELDEEIYAMLAAHEEERKDSLSPTSITITCQRLQAERRRRKKKRLHSTTKPYSR